MDGIVKEVPQKRTLSDTEFEGVLLFCGKINLP